MVSLVDCQRELTATFEDVTSAERTTWRVRFVKYPAYRNIDEAYRTNLWKWLDESNQRCGNTFTVTQTPALRSWDTVYLHEVAPDIRHYVIATNDDVLEVLSLAEPTWEPAAPLPLDAEPSGKSKHLYTDKDDSKINQLIKKIRSNNKLQDDG